MIALPGRIGPDGAAASPLVDEGCGMDFVRKGC
jgi:hypothetical protein